MQKKRHGESVRRRIKAHRERLWSQLHKEEALADAEGILAESRLGCDRTFALTMAQKGLLVDQQPDGFMYMEHLHDAYFEDKEIVLALLAQLDGEAVSQLWAHMGETRATAANGDELELAGEEDLGRFTVVNTLFDDKEVVLAGLPKALPVAWISDRLRSDADVLHAVQKLSTQTLAGTPSNGPKERVDPKPVILAQTAEDQQELEKSIEVLLTLGQGLHGRFLSAEWDTAAKKLSPVLLENVPLTANDALDALGASINSSLPPSTMCTLL
jgi:hypothetical protein